MLIPNFQFIYNNVDIVLFILNRYLIIIWCLLNFIVCIIFLKIAHIETILDFGNDFVHHTMEYILISLFFP